MNENDAHLSCSACRPSLISLAECQFTCAALGQAEASAGEMGEGGKSHAHRAPRMTQQKNRFKILLWYDTHPWTINGLCGLACYSHKVLEETL